MEMFVKAKYAVLTNEKLVVRTGAFLKSLLNQSFSWNFIEILLHSWIVLQELANWVDKFCMSGINKSVYMFVFTSEIFAK